MSSPEGTAHALRAYVPRGEGPRPLLVLFDGQNVFGDHGSYAGGWHAQEAVDKLSPASAPIVLGIAHGGVHRVRELGAHVALFLDSVVVEAVTRAEAVFDLKAPRFIGGSSLGGRAALLAWVGRPDRWDGALVMSPSLWFGHQSLLRGVSAGAIPLPTHGRLYLDAGARERGRMFADAEQLAKVLTHRGMGPDRLMWRPDQRGGHHERHWRRRLPKALRFLFKAVRSR